MLKFKSPFQLISASYNISDFFLLPTLHLAINVLTFLTCFQMIIILWLIDICQNSQSTELPALNASYSTQIFHMRWHAALSVNFNITWKLLTPDIKFFDVSSVLKRRRNVFTVISLNRAGGLSLRKHPFLFAAGDVSRNVPSGEEWRRNGCFRRLRRARWFLKWMIFSISLWKYFPRLFFDSCTEIFKNRGGIYHEFFQRINLS